MSKSYYKGVYLVCSHWLNPIYLLFTHRWCWRRGPIRGCWSWSSQRLEAVRVVVVGTSPLWMINWRTSWWQAVVMGMLLMRWKHSKRKLLRQTVRHHTLAAPNLALWMCQRCLLWRRANRLAPAWEKLHTTPSPMPQVSVNESVQISHSLLQ